jgi:hypothetical protein
VFVGLANLVVDLYARGVVRSAVDEGARAGAPVDAGRADCEQRAHDVVRTLLGGAMGRSVRLECHEQGGRMTAVARVELPSWMPTFVPGWAFGIVGSASKERSP